MFYDRLYYNNWWNTSLSGYTEILYLQETMVADLNIVESENSVFNMYIIVYQINAQLNITELPKIILLLFYF